MKFTFTDSAIKYILKQINKFDEITYDIIIDAQKIKNFGFIKIGNETCW